MMYLGHRWKILWEKINHRGDIHEFFNEMVAGYERPYSAYHNLHFHILHCLRELDGVANLCVNPEAVELALWLHDVHHNDYGTDNEEQSACFTLHFMEKLNVGAGFQRSVRDHILATKHVSVPKRLDNQIVADIDLSIMGYPAHIYQEAEVRITLEYMRVPTEIFRTKRAEILRGFLERDRIYATDFFLDKYEDQARKNLEAALRRLET